MQTTLEVALAISQTQEPAQSKGSFFFGFFDGRASFSRPVISDNGWLSEGEVWGLLGSGWGLRLSVPACSIGLDLRGGLSEVYAVCVAMVVSEI